jgi:diguanylate cyclase (GGDEF)-like protein
MPQRAARLIEAVQELSLAGTVEDVQRIVRTAARDLAGSDGATVVLRDGSHCFYADEDAIAPLWKGLRFPMEACISGWSMLHREPVVIGDVYVDDRIPHDAYRPTFVQSLVMVPIRRRDPIGALGNYWATSHTATPDEVAVLQALADSTSVALERIAALQDLQQAREEISLARQDAGRDELTGLANRRGFLLLAEQALETVRRTGQHAALLFVDLDGLKHVNDQHGHAAGDALLLRMADVLRATFRGADVLGRLGGDEFVALCTLRSASEEPAARLSAAMSGATIVGLPELVGSIGVAEYEPGDSIEDLLAAADAAMYLEKNQHHARAARTPGASTDLIA